MANACLVLFSYDNVERTKHRFHKWEFKTCAPESKRPGRIVTDHLLFSCSSAPNGADRNCQVCEERWEPRKKQNQQQENH